MKNKNYNLTGGEDEDNHLSNYEDKHINEIDDKRTFNRYWINNKAIYVSGEFHNGKGCLFNFDKYDKPLTVLGEACNIIFPNTKIINFGNFIPYFNYWYVKNFKNIDIEMYGINCKDYKEILKKESKPYKSIYKFIPIDYRAGIECCPLFQNYMFMPWIEVGYCRKDENKLNKFLNLLNFNKITIEDIKKSNYYNPLKSDDYYEILIKKYQTVNFEDLINHINYIKNNMTIFEFFQDITFEYFKINDIIKNHFNYKAYIFMEYYSCIQDILTLKTIFEELEKDNDIFIHVGNNHAIKICKFIDKYFNPLESRIKEDEEIFKKMVEEIEI